MMSHQSLIEKENQQTAEEEENKLLAQRQECFLGLTEAPQPKSMAEKGNQGTVFSKHRPYGTPKPELVRRYQTLLLYAKHPNIYHTRMRELTFTPWDFSEVKNVDAVKELINEFIRRNDTKYGDYKLKESMIIQEFKNYIESSDSLPKTITIQSPFPTYIHNRKRTSERRSSKSLSEPAPKRIKIWTYEAAILQHNFVRFRATPTLAGLERYLARNNKMVRPHCCLPSTPRSSLIETTSY